MLEAITASRDRLGEGPWWDAGVLTWVDIRGNAVRTWSPGDPAYGGRELPGEVSLALPCTDGRRVVAQVDRLLLDDGSTLTELCEIDAGNEHTRLNDGVCDAQGRLWVGTYSTRGQPEAALYLVTGDGTVRTALSGLYASNGVGWSGDVLYATDTGVSRIDRYRLVGSGLVPDGTLMTAGDGEGRPDGLTVDAEGCVWTAMWGGSELRRYAPDGTLLTEVPVPVTHPTSVCLGGADLRTLFVTTSAVHVEGAGQPLAGALLALQVDVPGLPVNRFAVSR